MLEFTMIEPSMAIIAAGNNMFSGTVQGILYVIVRVTDYVLNTVQLPTVFVPGIKRYIFPVRPQLKKAVKQSLKRMAHLSTLEPLVSS